MLRRWASTVRTGCARPRAGHELLAQVHYSLHRHRLQSTDENRSAFAKGVEAPYLFVPQGQIESTNEIIRHGTLHGVPMQSRPDGIRMLELHIHDNPHKIAARRESLLGNSGPKGAGKTTMMTLNAIEAAKLGCVCFSVDFNGTARASSNLRPSFSVTSRYT